jgi:putative oxidoreductase
MTTSQIPVARWPHATGARVSHSRPVTVALWAAQLAAAAMFLFAGSLKLTGAPMMVAMFDVIGIGQWFRYLTGSIEVVSAILLLVPSLALFGALLLIPTMIGAVLTHLFIVGGSPAIPIVLLALTIAIAWTRRPRRSLQ